MANIIRLSSTSCEYIRVKVSATESGVVINPTTLAVSFAFPAPGTDPSTWYNGSWETTSTDYLARCLVGPGGTATLTDGIYDVYVKVASSPETPVKFVGTIVVE